MKYSTSKHYELFGFLFVDFFFFYSMNEINNNSHEEPTEVILHTLERHHAEHDGTVTTSRNDTDDLEWEHTLIARAQSGFVSDGDEDDVVAAENKETEVSESAVISAEEAAIMVEKLKRFGVHNKSKIIDAMLNVERNIEQVKFDNRRKLKQSKVTNFFIPYSE